MLIHCNVPGSRFPSQREGKVSHPSNENRPMSPRCGRPRPRGLPGPPHGPGVGDGGRAESFPAVRSLRTGAVVLLAVGLVQVGAEILAGEDGG